MTRIAHLTDLHLLESSHARRRARERFRLSVLTMGRSIDADEHRRRFVFALREARSSRADHLVISGDLTEDGLDAQFDVLAEVLADSAWSPDEVTIVPGNHDGYDRPDAWERALEGPLRAYRRTSAPGAATELNGATIVATSTLIDQHWLRAAGRIGEEQCARMRDVLATESKRGRAVVFPMHHPPVPWGLRLNFLEGLLDVERVTSILRAHDNGHVLSGHTHRGGDHSLGDDRVARVFIANAVVDHDAPLRLYEACAGRLFAIDERVSTPDALGTLALA